VVIFRIGGEMEKEAMTKKITVNLPETKTELYIFGDKTIETGEITTTLPAYQSLGLVKIPED
jgi:hypothetical protein